MSGYQDDCGEFAVTPMLCMPSNCYENPPECFPCLPGCPKGQLMYCCEMKPEKGRKSRYNDDDYDRRERTPPRRRERSPVRPPRRSSDKDSHPEPCCASCKPVKTKYVIPCYRYEDGRINQPTLLMRRACEVAVGNRSRKKPFVESSFRSNADSEFHRYHSEDDRGNCCFHFEKKTHSAGHCRNSSKSLYQPCMSSPECHFADCVQAKAIDPKPCCFYC